MKAENLKKLKEEISKLSEEERIQRDIYLRKLALGELQGPFVGYPSIDKPWLKYYPEDAIKANIPKKTAYEAIYDNNKEYAGTALNYFGKKISYKKLFKMIEKSAKSFKQIGVMPGDVVTIAMPMSPESVYLLYALNKIGAVSNFIDPRLKCDEIKNIISETNSKYVVFIDKCMPLFEKIEGIECIDKMISVSPLESLFDSIPNFKKINDNNKIINWKDFIKLGNNIQFIENFEYKNNYPVTIVHTGGTTGKSKGVVLTNENFNSMALAHKISEYNINTGDKFLTFLPPFIAYSIVNSIHDPLYVSLSNTLVPTFSPEEFPKLIKKYKPNHVLSGPILWNYMINDKNIDKIDLSFLKSPVSGGDSLNIELEQQINSFLIKHKCNQKIQQGYGMSEVSSAATYSTNKSYKLGSVGVPYAKNIVTVFDQNSMDEKSYDEEGEIYISSPTMMLEYFKNPSETNDIFKYDFDGRKYVKTGDIGHIDSDGNLFVKGRIKRMIVRSGNKIFPVSVENYVLENSYIENCAIVSMSDEKEKNVPVIFIKLKDECIDELTNIVDDIRKNILQKMPEHCAPVKYIFVDDLPLTGINKIDYKKLEIIANNFDENSDYILDERQSLRLTKK